MSDMERFDGELPESARPEPSNEDSRTDTYLTAKLLGGVSAGLSLISYAESLAGLDSVSLDTSRFAGIVAVGAACSAAAGFFLKEGRN